MLGASITVLELDWLFFSLSRKQRVAFFGAYSGCSDSRLLSAKSPHWDPTFQNKMAACPPIWSATPQCTCLQNLWHCRNVAGASILTFSLPNLAFKQLALEIRQLQTSSRVCPHSRGVPVPSHRGGFEASGSSSLNPIGILP